MHTGHKVMMEVDNNRALIVGNLLGDFRLTAQNSPNGTVRFKNVDICLNTKIYSYLETSGGQSSNPYLNVVHFSTPELIRNLWQLKTAVFLHWCLIRAVPLFVIVI